MIDIALRIYIIGFLLHLFSCTNAVKRGYMKGEPAWRIVASCLFWPIAGPIALYNLLTTKSKED